ncbi:MAG: hypothetical protein OXI30_06900 [Chloroflexota bacterium]|nr:hypothetical protein [Chloroflexota bacterium]
MNLGFSVHLVDQDSERSIARRDEWADRQHGVWLFGPEYAPLFRQRMDLELDENSPTNRAFWIVLTIWRKKAGAFVRQAVLASDLPLLGERQVILDELVLPRERAASIAPAPTLAEFQNGFALEAVQLPERAQAGESLSIPISWRASERGLEDHAQFLHFGHEESGEWWTFDQAPLGDRLPTRLWYSGLADSEIWQVALPADLAAGRYAIFTGLYRMRDKERVIAWGADKKPYPDARIPLGNIVVKSVS